MFAYEKSNPPEETDRMGNDQSEVAYLRDDQETGFSKLLSNDLATDSQHHQPSADPDQNISSKAQANLSYTAQKLQESSKKDQKMGELDKGKKSMNNFSVRQESTFRRNRRSGFVTDRYLEQFAAAHTSAGRSMTGFEVGQTKVQGSFYSSLRQKETEQGGMEGYVDTSKLTGKKFINMIKTQ